MCGTNEQVFSAWASGGVMRCHADSRDGMYTVAEHVGGMMLLLFQLKESPSEYLCRAIAQHDMAEFILGDLPHTAKVRFPELRLAYEKAEAEVEDEMNAVQCHLSRTDRAWLRALDLLDFWMFALHRFHPADPRTEVALKALRKMEDLPAEVREFITWRLGKGSFYRVPAGGYKNGMV